MQPKTLAAWMFRIISNPKRTARVASVVLVPPALEGEPQEPVQSWKFTDGANKDELREVSAELLAAAQDYADLREARTSFVVRLAAEDDQTVVASQPLRIEPKEMSEAAQALDGADPADMKATSAAVIAATARQNALAFTSLLTAPKRLQESYEHMLDLQQKRIDALEKRNLELLGLLHDLLATAAGDDPVAKAELEAQREMWAKVGVDVSNVVQPIVQQLGERLLSKFTGEAPPPEESTVQ